MQSYQINELERLTGIKAHTIRIWEKRYELIKPYRTDTNRRYYDDSQVRKLLNVTTLLSNGYKISKIASFSEIEINKLILNQAEEPDETNAGYVNGLVKAMLAFDKKEFEGTLAAAIAANGIYYAVLNVIYPFLKKTGIFWVTDNSMPVQEHFASSIIRRKLITATDQLPQLTKHSKQFLLFLPPQEWHETGLLFADYILRSNGYETIYLGQNVPIENVHIISGSLHPAYMLLFYVATKPVSEIEKQISNLSKNNPDTSILVAGTKELFADIKSVFKNVTYLSDVSGLTSLIG